MKNELQTKENQVFQSFDMTSKLPNLHESKELQIDLTSEYWTPNQVGEFKLCFFQEIKPSVYKDEKSGEVIELECVFFIAQDADGTTRTIRNGSMILVSTLSEYVEKGTLVQGTPLKITFNGKRRTSNGNQVDTWSVKPLIVS